MDDLDMLRNSWGDDPQPSPEAESRARTALLDRATTTVPVHRSRLLRFGWRLAVPAAAAAVAIAAVAVLENAGPVGRDGRVAPVLPGLPAARPADAAQALENAATTAGGRTFTAPGPEQWLYLEMQNTTGTGPGGVITGGPYRTQTSRVWWRIDGTKFARYKDGKLVTSPSASATVNISHSYPYATLTGLPADPDAILSWVDRTVGDAGGSTRDGRDQIAFATINGILRENVLPPALEAAFFRALAELSGVTLVPDEINVDGRPALAVARVEDGWLREEVLLDPRTYRLIGERAIAIADHKTTADDGTWTVRKGTVERLIVRSAAAIVEAPGEIG
jgi:hypothetical protein